MPNKYDFYICELCRKIISEQEIGKIDLFILHDKGMLLYFCKERHMMEWIYRHNRAKSKEILLKDLESEKESNQEERNRKIAALRLEIPPDI